MGFISRSFSCSPQLPFTCDGCGERFTRKKLLTDHFGICQAHLLKVLAQRGNQPSPIIDDGVPTPVDSTVSVLQAQTPPLSETILQPPNPEAIVLHHATLVHETQLQPSELSHLAPHVQQHTPVDAALQLQPIPLIGHHVQTDDSYQSARIGPDQLILLPNTVEGSTGADMDPGIKVQVYSLL